MSQEAPLTEHERQMTAYIDDELSPQERAAFEKLIAEDPELAKETVRYQNLVDLSRSMALTEPADHEIRRFWARFYNRTEWQLGWVLLILGLIVLAGEGLYLLLATDQLNWILKGAILCSAVGAGLLLWNTTRLKLRTSHLDRYRGVMR